LEIRDALDVTSNDVPSQESLELKVFKAGGLFVWGNGYECKEWGQQGFKQGFKQGRKVVSICFPDVGDQTGWGGGNVFHSILRVLLVLLRCT
jgi:hypothetical protein